MLEKFYSEISLYQERMHRKSKKKFREYLKLKAKEFNLTYQTKPKSIFSKNVVIGDLKKAKYVLGAHYDTPPRMPSFLMRNITFFNIFSILFVFAVFLLLVIFEAPIVIGSFIYLISLLYLMGIGIANKYNFNDNTSGVLTLLGLMNEIKSDNVAYVFFDNEEKGLIGSMQFAKYLRKTKQYNASKKVYINFDCVGRGNVFAFSEFGNNILSNELIKITKDLENNDYTFITKKPSIFAASDHFSFKCWNSLGVVCYNKQGKKYQLNNIHCHKDNYIDLFNIKILIEIIKKFIEKGTEDERRIKN